jgi:tRNA uridine 5-carbamoylmethylation protein Kti12
MSEPICTVMVGLPGLGKSTIANFGLGVYDRIEMPVFVYSTDHYIENIAKMRGLTYDDVFAETIKEATEMCNDGLDSAIADGLDIVWDQTNLGVGKRRKIINRMKQAGYQVRCDCIVPPEEGHFSDLKDWKYRLANRPGKTIPDEVLSNMYKSFVMPTIEEGFDMITFYNMHGALLGIDYGENE